MIKILFFFSLLTSFLNAMPTVIVEQNDVNIKHFKLEYFVDATTKLKLHDVKSQNFETGTNSLSLGKNKTHTWIRFAITNKTAKKKKLFIHNKHAYVANKIEFYELKNNKVLSKLFIDLANKNDTQKKMYATDAIFQTTLESNETKTIYIKNIMNSMQYPYFEINDAFSSKKSVAKGNTILFIILGMLIALALYHAMLYLTSKRKEYIYYSLYLASAVVWQSFLSGMLASNFGIYFDSISREFLLSVLLIPIFLAMFSKTIFETKQKFPLEDKLLNSVVFLFSFGFLIGFYKLEIALHIASTLYFYMLIILLFTTYRFMKAGNPLALIFIIGNSVFSFFALISNLYFIGFFQYNAFVFSAAMIGILIEAILLAFILSFRIKILQKENISKDKMIFHQSKMSAIGQMIENIGHQWRQPLSQINSCIFVVESEMNHHNYQNEKIETKLHEIENFTSYMSKTIDDFKNYFTPNKQKNTFFLNELIDDTLKLLENMFERHSIIIEKNISQIVYNGYKNELQQVLLVILTNSKDILSVKNTKNAKITINIKETDEHCKIEIFDNGGGIQEDILDRIFEPYYSTKHSSQGTGLGLYISKMIIEDSMLSQLHVHNTKEGACFTILLTSTT
ncbi:sensor histidine kinase [Sulfurimonas sp. SAG-AH-194-C20]|nr:sensor histidine kinase [Sulfurimonas sp. SAG-AH-194-C20]MDF1878237.1 sensor histidine kinase [Sulfurimonas sp. SAG-AH-194-C20]